MPSFKATVEATTSTGALIVNVLTDTCIPASLGVTMASVNALPGSGSPMGVYQIPHAVTYFPSTTLDDFVTGQKVKISWRGSRGPMLNLMIRSG